MTRASEGDYVVDLLGAEGAQTVDDQVSRPQQEAVGSHALHGDARNTVPLSVQHRPGVGVDAHH